MFYLTDTGEARLRHLEDILDGDRFQTHKEATEFLVLNSIDNGFDDLNAIIHRVNIPEHEVRQELRHMFEARLIEED